jgi:hypothetical protein
MVWSLGKPSRVMVGELVSDAKRVEEPALYQPTPAVNPISF